MTASIRFHLDEHIHPAVAGGLRQRGIDVTTTLDAGVQGASDAEQLTFATSHERVLVTHDDDFLRLHQAGTPHHGIAYCHPLRRSVGDVIRGLVLIWELLSPDDMKNHVEFL